MINLAKNFAEAKKLKESYTKLIQMLDRVGMRTEESFTIESLCRILKNRNEQKEEIQQIINISAINANSYDTYYMNITPVAHEFPLENDDSLEKTLILATDRYMALMHILTLLKTTEGNEAKKIIKIAAELKSKIIKQTEVVNNKELVTHVMDVTQSGEFVATKTLKNFENIDVLLYIINFGYITEELCLKILNKYYEADDTKHAIKFYNEYYAPKFNLLQCTNIDQIEQRLVDVMYTNKEYKKALSLELDHAIKNMRGKYE